jgi:hypothetical protein
MHCFQQKQYLIIYVTIFHKIFIITYLCSDMTDEKPSTTDEEPLKQLAESYTERMSKPGIKQYSQE